MFDQTGWSPFRRALQACVDAARASSWTNYNSATTDIVRNLIVLGAEFHQKDTEWLDVAFRLVGPKESLYTYAVIGKNDSAAKAFEAAWGRKPFFYRERTRDGFVGKKRRAREGTSLDLPDPDGVWRGYEVSSFSDGTGRINLMPTGPSLADCVEKGWPADVATRGHRQRVSMSNDDFNALFPADRPPATDVVVDVLMLAINHPAQGKTADTSEAISMREIVARHVGLWSAKERRIALKWAEVSINSDAIVVMSERHVANLAREMESWSLKT